MSVDLPVRVGNGTAISKDSSGCSLEKESLLSGRSGNETAIYAVESEVGGLSGRGQRLHPLPLPHNSPSGPPLTPILKQLHSQHRGELDVLEKYNYDLSKAQLKASSRTSALLAGFAMVALVELQYDSSTPHYLLILLAVVTTLLVSVHLLALMMSTCILPYMEATGPTQDSPHNRLKLYIDLSWLFSTCIGLVLFLVEIGVIFFVKFNAAGYDTAGFVTTALLVPVLLIFVVISCLIHRSRADYNLERMDKKMSSIKQMLNNESLSMMKVV